MPRNGSGVYALPNADVVFDTVIDQTVYNSNNSDIGTALSGSIAKNGETVITANLPMANFKHTGISDASARTEYASAGQVQDGKLNWVAAGGTVDVITASFSPAIAAVADGMILCIRASGANTVTTPSFSPNGLTARTIVKNGGVALVAGDISAAGHELQLRYLAASTRWELLNPKGTASPTTTRGDVITRGGSADQRLALGATNTGLISDGTDAVWGTILRPSVTATLTKGFNVTPNALGTITTGTTTPDPTLGNVQTFTNGGAFTLAVPATDCTMLLQGTNNGSAGAITTSGYTKVTGSFTTVNGDDFFVYITKVGAFSFLNIVALQ